MPSSKVKKPSSRPSARRNSSRSGGRATKPKRPIKVLSSTSRKEERHNDLTWEMWLVELCPMLGYLPKADAVDIKQHMVDELGVALNDLVDAWSNDLTPDQFVKLHPRYVSTKPQHNHSMGEYRCGLCRLEKTLPREGAVPWETWGRKLQELLGYPSSWTTESVDDGLRRAKVDIKDATEYWSRNFRPAGYVTIRGLKPGPRKAGPIHLNDGDDVAYCGSGSSALTADPDEMSCVSCRKVFDAQKPKWDGMAPCGKHGADYEGQQCTLCPRPVVRLFDQETEVCTPLGQQVSMHVRHRVDDMIKWLLEQDPNASMRDFEYLLFSSLQMATARQILLRRRH